MVRLDYDEAIARLDALIGETGDDPKGRKRRAILDAATDLFIQHGFRKTNVGDVARAAGVAKGTVYLYFGSKAELLIAAVAREKRNHLERVKGIFDDDITSKEKLRRFIELGLAAMVHMPLVSRLVSGDYELGAVLDAAPEEMRAQTEADRQRIHGGLIEEIVGPGRLSPQELRERLAVFNGIFGLGPLLNQEHVHLGIGPERFARVLSEIFVDGLERHGGGGRDEREHNDGS